MTKHKRYSPTGRMIAIIIVIMQVQTTESVQHTVAKEGCQGTCGGIPIPYPFGIGPNCFLEGFELECDTTYNPPKLFSGVVVVKNISLSLGQAYVNYYISSQCYNPNNNSVTSHTYGLTLGKQFRFNNEKNMFTVIGCEVLAYIYFGNYTKYLTNKGGCVSTCLDQGSIINGSCAGIGCCQTAIPKQTSYYEVSFETNYYNNSLVYNFSRCSYAVLMENNGFEFRSDYITTDKLYEQQLLEIVISKFPTRIEATRIAATRTRATRSTRERKYSRRKELEKSIRARQVRKSRSIKSPAVIDRKLLGIKLN